LRPRRDLCTGGARQCRTRSGASHQNRGTQREGRAGQQPRRGRAVTELITEPMTVLERTTLLPDVFTRSVASRRCTPRAQQLGLVAKAQAGRSVLLIAPTGGGKALAGFLPSLVELSAPAVSASGGTRKLISTGRGIQREGGLHTLYISPLKALAVDIA